MAGSGLQPTLIAILYLCPAISGFVVAVRLWRKRKDRTLGGDDALILLAWLIAIVNTIVVHFYVLELYVGYHDADVPKKLDRKKIAKLQYALAVTYNPVVCVLKASFLWSLQKLRSSNVWIRRSLWAIQIINGAYFIAQLGMGLAPCVPLARNFDKTIPGGCYDSRKFIIGTVTVVLATDAMVLIMPTWIIYDLQMAIKRKIITIAFLSLGLIVIAIGILRLIWLTNKFKGKTSSYSVEQSYSALECNIAIIGASGPTVKYLLGRLIPSLRSDTRNTKASNYGNSSSNNGVSHRARSKYNTEAYDDLDTVTARQEEFEMKGDWRWKHKHDSDANSDEQKINDDIGIVKTVDWTVSSNTDSFQGRPGMKSDTRVAVKPVDVV